MWLSHTQKFGFKPTNSTDFDECCVPRLRVYAIVSYEKNHSSFDFRETIQNDLKTTQFQALLDGFKKIKSNQPLWGGDDPN